MSEASERHCSRIPKKFDPQLPLIVHWEGKLLPDLTGSENVNLLIVLVSDNGHGQLLAVPKIPSGTRKVQARAVFDALKEWNIEDKVTTTSNTGRHKGACVILEQLHIGCWHQILELVAGAAFTEAMGSSSCPEVHLFKDFKARWECIDQHGRRNSQEMTTGN